MNSNEHPIENLMKSTMESIKDMVDVNTIIGEAVETKDGSVIIPVSKVSFGFASGGSEFNCDSSRNNDDDKKYPFGGGCGAGVSIKPVAFLVMTKDIIKILPVDINNPYDRILDTIPQAVDMIKDMINKITRSDLKNKNIKVDIDTNECSCKLKEED